MVSRETKHHISPDFIAGVISTSGTFLHTKTAKVEQFGFQIKMPKENIVLLEMIRIKIGLHNKVKIYTSPTAEFAILITRSKSELFNKVMPFIDEKLLGFKLQQYLKWKNDIISSI